MDDIEKLREDNRTLASTNMELQIANQQLESVLSNYLVKALDYGDPVFDQCEIHRNVTVEIWRDSRTGKQSFGWRRENE